MLIIFSAGYSETFPLNLRMLGPTHLFAFPIVGLCFVSKTMCAIVEIDGVLQYFLILATQRNHLRGISRCYIALYLFADKPGNGNKQVNIVRFPRKHSCNSSKQLHSLSLKPVIQMILKLSINTTKPYLLCMP